MKLDEMMNIMQTEMRIVILICKGISNLTSNYSLHSLHCKRSAHCRKNCGNKVVANIFIYNSLYNSGIHEILKENNLLGAFLKEFPCSLGVLLQIW
jgi:hypothetical protein